MPIAYGWCYCKEKHSDVRSCPGPVKPDQAGKTCTCEHCGSKYRQGDAKCETVLCNKCNGKRLQVGLPAR